MYHLQFYLIFLNNCSHWQGHVTLHVKTDHMTSSSYAENRCNTAPDTVFGQLCSCGVEWSHLYLPFLLSQHHHNVVCITLWNYGLQHGLFHIWIGERYYIWVRRGRGAIAKLFLAQMASSAYRPGVGPPLCDTHRCKESPRPPPSSEIKQGHTPQHLPLAINIAWKFNKYRVIQNITITDRSPDK